MPENPFAHLMPQSSAPARGQVFTLPKDPTKEASAEAELRNKNLSAEEARLRIAKMQRDAVDAENAANPALNPSNLHGEDYLRTLPPGIAGQVKLIADGKLAVPSSRSKQWSALIQHVFNYDPSFDQIDYNARLNTRKDFTSGKSAQNIKALNTAIGHVGQLSDQIDGTASHGGFPLATTVNRAVNAYERSSGDAGITQFEQTAGAVASELTQVFRGSGGAEADVKRYLGELNSNASEAQKRAAIRNIAGLLNSRLQAIGDQYQKGMGTAAQPLQLLDDHAQKVMALISGAAPGASPPGAPPAPPGPGTPPLAPPPGGNGGGTVNKSTMYYGGPGGYSTVATGAFKSGPDTEANAVVDKMFRGGASADSINAKLVQMGRRPLDPLSFDKARTWHKSHPDYTGGFANMVTEAPTTADERTSTSRFDALMAHAANALTFDNMDSMSADPGKRRADLSAMEGMHPLESNVGAIGGAGLSAAGLEMGGTALATKLGLGAGALPWVRRGADATYGALEGAGANDENRMGGALTGGLASTVGGMFGRGVVGAGGKALTGVRNEAVNYLADRGIPLTAGQTLSQSGVLGRAVKGIEDRLTGIPVVGDAVNARRTEGLRAFNRAGFDEGLAPINANTGGLTGPHGIDAAQEAVDQGYTKALDGVQVTPDQQFVQDAAKTLAAGKAIPVAGPQFEHIVNTRVAPIFDSSANGTISGPKLQGALQGLRRANLGTDAMSVDGNSALRDLGGNIEDLVNRQAPGVMPAYQNANKAFRNEEILRDSVNRARNGSRSGEVDLFTPSQLADAAAANARRFGNTQGTTRQPFFDLTRAGQAVLPSKVPDSGTAGRLATLALPGVLGGSGAGVGYAAGDAQTGSEAGLSLGALLALGGTKAGQKLLVRALLKRPDAAIRIGGQVQKIAPVGGIFGAGLGPSILPSAN